MAIQEYPIKEYPVESGIKEYPIKEYPIDTDIKEYPISQAFNTARKTLGSIIKPIQNKFIQPIQETSIDIAQGKNPLDFRQERPADLTKEPSLTPYTPPRQLTPEEQKIQAEANLDVQLYSIADDIATIGFDSKEEALKTKQKQDFIISRAPLIAAGMASPIAALAFEGFQQIKNIAVANNLAKEYSPTDTRQLTDILPEDTPQPLRLGLSVAEMVGDVALIGTLLNLSEKGLFNSTMKEVSKKMADRGYSKEEIGDFENRLRNVVKGSVEKNIQARFRAGEWEPPVNVPENPVLPAGSTEIPKTSKLAIDKPSTIPIEGTKSPISAIIPENKGIIPKESDIKAIIEQNGGQYTGIQKGDGLVPDQAMFNAPNIKNTFAIPINEVTPEAVKAKIEGFAKNKPVIESSNQGAVKEPWQMTKEELSTKISIKELHKIEQKIDSEKFKWYEKNPMMDSDTRLSDFHKQSIQQALSKGKPVSEEVLKDYPELQKLVKKTLGSKKITEQTTSELPNLQSKLDNLQKQIQQYNMKGQGYKAVDLGLESNKIRKEIDKIKLEQNKLTPESGAIANPVEVGAKLKEHIDKKWIDIRENVEDDWVRVKKLIQQKGVNVNDTNNPYEAEIRYWGRVGTRMESVNDEISGIDKEIVNIENKFKSSTFNKDIDRYLIAKHTPERNIVHGEGASGYTNEEAKGIIEEIEKKPYSKEVKDIGDKIKKLNEKTLDILLEGEVISKEFYNDLRKKYPNHVPLQRIMDEGDDFVDVLTKKGFGVQGSGIKRAFGSKREVADILGNITANIKSAIARTEKNIVDLHTVKFAKDNNYFDGLFEEFKPKAIGQSFKGNILKEYVKDPKVLPYREKGEQKYLKINDPQLAVALRGVNRTKVDGLLKIIGSFTRLYSGLMTRFNPEFSVPNKIRDLQETMVYLASKNEIGAKGALKTVTKDPSSIKSIVDYMLGRDTEGAKLYKELKMEGGTTGGLGLSTKEQIEIDIAKIRAINRSRPRKAAEIALKVIDNWNTIFEDSTRLSVYKQALNQGISKKRAAVLAKEASINFNKMGTTTPVINAGYMFANASVQGSAKMLRAMLKNPKVAGMVLMALGGSIYAVNEYNDNIDKDWRSKVSKWDKLNGLNIMIPTNKGARYITIPISWGLKPLKVGLQAMIDYSDNKELDIKKTLGDVITSVIEGFNPIGGTDVVSALVPTILDLPVELARNRSWTGGKIRPDWNQSSPDSIKYFDNLRQKASGRKFIEWTRKLGDKGIEISPADLTYAFNSYIGGVGRFTEKMFETISGVSKAEKIEARNIPFVSRFYRDIPEEQIKVESRDFEDIKKLLQKQDKERFYLKQEAELSYEGMKNIPKEQAKYNYSKIKENNQKLADKIKEIAIDEQLNLDYTERLIKQLGIENGERAKYIWKKVNELKTKDERIKYVKNLKDKKILTDKVNEQIGMIANKLNKRTLGSKRITNEN